jgi:hypothetical protein
MPPRLRRLPTLPVSLRGREVRVAATVRARLMGLAGLRAPPPCGLLLVRTRSVHTFGMRFALDVYFLDGDGRVLFVHRGVPPRRLRRCRGARAVLEIPSAQGGESAPPAP